jgi:hypothetical protein
MAADGFEVGILSSSGKVEALAKEFDGIGVMAPTTSMKTCKRW